MQSPYCSDTCWHEHAKDGRVHGPADTKAWAEDTTNAIWRRGRLKEANVDPRGVGTLQVDIQVGDPLPSLFHQQKREQEETLIAQKGQGSKRCRQETT